jgi:hypothetical protein
MRNAPNGLGDVRSESQVPPQQHQVMSSANLNSQLPAAESPNGKFF